MIIPCSNNNNNNDNDNIFEIMVTNSRRKRILEVETDSPGKGCVKKWICNNSKVVRGNDFEKFVEFSLTFTLAKIWNVDVASLDAVSCERITCLLE